MGRAGKHSDLKPSIVDVVLILFIWGGAIYSRLALDVNKWFLILLWVTLGVTVGIIAASVRRLPETTKSAQEKHERAPARARITLWERWKEFSKRMGSFQSRVILTLLFFLVVSPFAIAVRVLSDPLRIKSRPSESYWLFKKEMTTDLETFRKQF